MFETFEAAQRWIESVQKFGQKLDLTRMKEACKLLDHPQLTFKTIHIGGTNGKGSTLNFLKHILAEAGYRVGTFTSPYVVHFNERITLDGEPIPQADLLHYINIIHDFQERYRREYGDQITFFELMTLISFLYFRDRDVDVVLYEVGLGGRLDATNVIAPLLAVITSVGYDHMHVLGDNLASIAREKLGIVKDGVPLVSGHMDETLDETFREVTDRKQAPLYLAREEPLANINPGPPTTFQFQDTDYTINQVGLHQVENARTALIAADVLARRDAFRISAASKRRGLERARMPGRFELVERGVILDGAHNISSLEALIASIKAYYPDTPIRVLFTVMRDKAYVPMLKRLERIADRLIFTELSNPRGERASVLLEHATHPRAEAVPDCQEAYARAKPEPSEDAILLAVGSLYFISELRRHILGEGLA